MERKRKTKMKMTVDEPPPPPPPITPINRQEVSIDDYKLLVLDESQPGIPFRTFSFDDKTIPPCNPKDDPRPEGETPFISILATLDGLVCVSLSWNWQQTRLVFLNPFTGALKELSPIPPCTRISPVADSVGFYFDDSCNDYKLVCLPGCGERTTALVYSHRYDSWRIIELPFDTPRELYFCSPPILYRQCLYFNYRCYVDTDFDGPLYTRIVCFDVKTETFREIPLPHPTADGASFFNNKLLAGQAVWFRL